VCDIAALIQTAPPAINAIPNIKSVFHLLAKNNAVNLVIIKIAALKI
jgi:hypothetical protein